MNNVECTFLNEHQLPLVIQAKNNTIKNIDGLIAFIHHNNAFFKAQLLHYGAVLFRGFHVSSANDLSNAITACELGQPYPYEPCVVPRTKIKDNIYTSIDVPSFTNVPLHNEKAYDLDSPSHIYFNCITPSEVGGNTPLLNGYQLWKSLPDALQQKLVEKGILYRKFFYGNSLEYRFVHAISQGKFAETWMMEFKTNDAAIVEKILNERQNHYRWENFRKRLIIDRITPAYRYHPINQKMVWFNPIAHRNHHHNGVYHALNQTIKNPLFRMILSQQRFLQTTAYYGDGEPISKADAIWLQTATENQKVSYPWQQGDFIVIDNYLCMHGKEPHKGARLIITGMTQ